MSDLDSNSSYESYSSDSVSSKSLPTPCELMLQRNVINQCEEKNKFEKEPTGSAVVNNEIEICKTQLSSCLSAQEISVHQKQDSSTKSTNLNANNDDVAQEISNHQKQHSSTKSINSNANNDDVAQEISNNQKQDSSTKSINSNANNDDVTQEISDHQKQDSSTKSINSDANNDDVTQEISDHQKQDSSTKSTNSDANNDDIAQEISLRAMRNDYIDSLEENDLVFVGTDVSCFYLKSKLHIFPGVIILSYGIIINASMRDDAFINNSLMFADVVIMRDVEFFFYCASSPRIADSELPVVITNENVILHFISASYQNVETISLQTFINQKLEAKSELSKDSEDYKRLKSSVVMKKHLMELTKVPPIKLRSRESRVPNEEAKNNENVTTDKDISKVLQKPIDRKVSANSSVPLSNKRGNSNMKDNKISAKKQKIVQKYNLGNKGHLTNVHKNSTVNQSR